MRVVMPPTFIRLPARMKNGTASSGKLSMPPIMRWMTTNGGGLPATITNSSDAPAIAMATGMPAPINARNSSLKAPGLIGAPRPTGTSAGPPRGRGPAWERPGARPAKYRVTQDVSFRLLRQLRLLQHGRAPLPVRDRHADGAPCHEHEAHQHRAVHDAHGQFHHRHGAAADA